MDIKLKLLFFESCKLRFVLTGVMALSIILVSNIVFAIESVEIEKAEYKSEDDEFKVEVKIKEDGEDTNHTVNLFDDITGEFLAEKTDDDETIKFKFSDISGSEVPCRVRAEVEGVNVAKDVKNAPMTCSSSGDGLVLQISEARYNDDDEKLKVKGRDAPSSAMVEIFDSVTGIVMDTVKAEDDGDFKSEIEDITGGEVPCMLQARANGLLSGTADVEGAPGDCGGGGGGGGNDKNLISLHDKNSPQYDKNCTNCHVAILIEESLDPSILTAHTSMLFETPGEKDNEKCGWCHRTVDLVQGSAGNLRKQVKADLCAVCHGDDFGEAKRYYQTSITDGEMLYELTCAFCHNDLANSEVGGKDAKEIQEKINEDKGGMKPLEELSPSQVQEIANALANAG
jgi:hypothetical protein